MRTFIYFQKFDVYCVDTMTMTMTMINEYCLETKTNSIILYSTVVEEVAKPIVLLPDLAFPLAILGILVYS